MNVHGKRAIKLDQPVSDSSQSSARAPKAISILTVFSLALVVLTPVVYFCGRAFHDGWYGELRLDPGMFPLDTAGMLTEGGVALGDIISFSADTLLEVTKNFPWRVVFLILGLSTTWVVVTKAGRWLDHRGLEWIGKIAHPIRAKVARFLGPFIKPTFIVALAFVMLFEFAFGLTSMFGLIVLPFYRMGQHEAKVAVSKGFSLLPRVAVKNPAGSLTEMREVGCGPQFCGLWNKDHAITVPVSALTWLESPKIQR